MVLFFWPTLYNYRLNAWVCVFVQTCTSAGWDGVLAGLMNDTPPGCNDTVTDTKPNGDCGNAGLAIVYLVTYLVMTFLVVINMYIAVILENFSQVSLEATFRLSQLCRKRYCIQFIFTSKSATSHFQNSSIHRSRIRYLSKKNSRILTNFAKLKKFVKFVQKFVKCPSES